MQLLYKEDTEEAQERLQAFWANACIDRPAIAVTAPREKPLPGPPAPPIPMHTPEGVNWEFCNKLDPEYRMAASDARMRATFFGGEAMPCFWTDTGPGCLMTLFGSQPKLRFDTVWFQRVEADWESYDLSSTPAPPHWEATLRLIREAQTFFAGKAWVTMTDLGGITDALALLRGKEDFFIDLADESKRNFILRARDQIRRKWQACYEGVFQMLDGPALGSIDWEGVWAPGRMYSIQSDTSVMLSPAMFDWLVAPELEALCDFLDYALFHLDSPGRPQHIDRLLAIPSLNAIEWSPGLAAPWAVDWIPLLKRIQVGGKALKLYDKIENVERLIRELNPAGLMVATGARSEEEARDLLRLAEGWAKRH